MYGFPDSAIVGTARRVRRYVRGNNLPKDHKGRPIPEDYAVDVFVEWLDGKWNSALDTVLPSPEKESLKLARQEYFERYGHYPAGDPR